MRAGAPLEGYRAAGMVVPVVVVVVVVMVVVVVIMRERERVSLCCQSWCTLFPLLYKSYHLSELFDTDFLSFCLFAGGSHAVCGGGGGLPLASASSDCNW